LTDDLHHERRSAAGERLRIRRREAATRSKNFSILAGVENTRMRAGVGDVLKAVTRTSRDEHE
jgi:hypothetical protein